MATNKGTMGNDHIQGLDQGKKFVEKLFGFDGNDKLFGNGGADGLRVLRTSGEVLRPQGSSWVTTGLSARVLATKQ